MTKDDVISDDDGMGIYYAIRIIKNVQPFVIFCIVCSEEELGKKKLSRQEYSMSSSGGTAQGMLCITGKLMWDENCMEKVLLY